MMTAFTLLGLVLCIATLAAIVARHPSRRILMGAVALYAFTSLALRIVP